MILRFGHIFVAVFALILQIYLHISFFCCTFSPANSRWAVCVTLQGEGADIFLRRLLTLVFDFLKPEKLQ